MEAHSEKVQAPTPEEEHHKGSRSNTFPRESRVWPLLPATQLAFMYLECESPHQLQPSKGLLTAQKLFKQLPVDYDVEKNSTYICTAVFSWFRKQTSKALPISSGLLLCMHVVLGGGAGGGKRRGKHGEYTYVGKGGGEGGGIPIG